jgi:tRNA(fMet)-specific endonuclease VapC
MPLEVVAFDESSVLAYGAIREELERAGALIGPLDTLIAAQAVAYSLIVVTNNERQFQGITKLKKIENWLL